MDVAERLSTQVRIFFEQIYEAGAFAARRIEEAFFVICDRRFNSPGGAPHRRVSIPDRLRRRAAARISTAYRICHSASGSSVQPVSLNRGNLPEFCPEELKWVENLASQLEQL